MDGPGHQFLAGAALARDQHGGIHLGHAADELIHLAHARAFAHHVVLHVHLGLQAAIFFLQPLHAARIIEREGGDTADGGQQLQMILIEAHLRIAGVQINRRPVMRSKTSSGTASTLRMWRTATLSVSANAFGWPAGRCIASQRLLSAPVRRWCGSPARSGSARCGDPIRTPSIPPSSPARDRRAEWRRDRRAQFPRSIPASAFRAPPSPRTELTALLIRTSTFRSPHHAADGRHLFQIAQIERVLFSKDDGGSAAGIVLVEFDRSGESAIAFRSRAQRTRKASSRL